MATDESSLGEEMDYGFQARQFFINQFLGKDVEFFEIPIENKIFAKVLCGNMDISLVLLKNGLALLSMPQEKYMKSEFEEYIEGENTAKFANAGIWKKNAVAPQKRMLGKIDYKNLKNQLILGICENSCAGDLFIFYVEDLQGFLRVKINNFSFIDHSYETLLKIEQKILKREAGLKVY